MKLVGVVAGMALAVTSVGAAHAQAAACGQVAQLMASTHAQVKALQGATVGDTKDATKFTSKTKVTGFSTCTVESQKEIDSFNSYWEHHLWCEAEAADAEAANQAVEALWACTRDIYVERAPNEAWIGGRYRVIGFNAEVTTAGRAAGLVDFGKSDYARIDVEKAFDTSDEYDLHIYWLFNE